jgi:methanogenic corrinoid protein MtbC1
VEAPGWSTRSGEFPLPFLEGIVSSETVVADRDTADLCERYLAAQLAGDRNAALRLVLDEGVGKGIAVPRLYLDVIEVAQHRIGQLWQENRISVAQEHVATAISSLVIAHLYTALPRAPSNEKRVLLSCVDGELHDLGARVTADFFEMAGYDVRYLGASLPTDHLVAMAREDPPDLLVLSMTLSLHEVSFRRAIAALRSAVGNRLHLGVGGQAFVWTPDLPQAVGAHFYGRDARESVAAADRLLGPGSA